MADQMTGLRKAAVLLLQLGKENAAKVLGQMREAEVEELTAEIVRLDFVDGAVVEGIVDEFHTMLHRAAARRAGRHGLRPRDAHPVARQASAPTRSSTGSRRCSGTCRSRSCRRPTPGRCSRSCRTSTRRRSPWCWRT